MLYGAVVLESHIERLLQDVGLAPSITVIAQQLADTLNGAAIDFILCNHALSTSTYGETEKFLKLLDKRIEGVVEAIFADGDPNAAISRMARILRGDDDGVDVAPYAQATLAEDINRLLLLQRRVRLVATWYKPRGGTKQQTNLLEIAFVAKLAEVFRETYGQELGYSTGTDQMRGGPGVRFLSGVLVIIEEYLLDAPDDLAGGLLTRLTSLKHPAALTDRIKDARGGKLRERKAKRP